MDARAVIESAGLEQVAADHERALRTAQALVRFASAMGDQAAALRDEGASEQAMEAEIACLVLSTKAEALATIANSPRDAEHAGVLASTALYELGRYQDALHRLDEVREALTSQGMSPGRAWRSERNLILRELQAVEIA